MATKYLYGAAVQGIQSFIFQTNKLREIVGASELVEEICTDMFDAYAKNGESVIRAAGNIKYIFNEKADCEKAVLNFPKVVMENAPGITISQAVVEYDESNFKQSIDELERKLKIQRNIPALDPIPAFMSIKRSPRTGIAAEAEKAGECWDDATMRKDIKGNNPKSICEKSFFGRDSSETLDSSEFAYDIDKITDHNDWIAIVHADGNSLGQVVKKVGTNKDLFKKFSYNLDLATEKAANQAFYEVIRYQKGEVTPLRPVVLGGDDMTAIIRGSLAVEYTRVFLKSFEQETKKLLGEQGLLDGVFDDGTKYLTACAGIAFVKSSYPFYYGANLAETLCGMAKKDARQQCYYGNSIPSCMMFHKVDDTFVEDFDAISERQLMPQSKITFASGPYYIGEVSGRFTIDDIIKNTDVLNSEKGNALKTGLRQWISTLYQSKAKADQKMHRLYSITADEMIPTLNFAQRTISMSKKIDDEEITLTAYPTFDMLALHTVKYQKTK